MYFLQLDQMLELAQQEQAELRRQAARDALLKPHRRGGGWRWPAAVTHLWRTFSVHDSHPPAARPSRHPRVGLGE